MSIKIDDRTYESAKKFWLWKQFGDDFMKHQKLPTFNEGRKALNETTLAMILIESAFRVKEEKLPYVDVKKVLNAIPEILEIAERGDFIESY
ncbi:MAG: hypothetical protein IJ728_01605 [Selenomonadaceae bacterium]|nr:hypothetical protein [Selenomonadaceae bacterium]